MTHTTANGRTILYKGHGMTHVCAPPDVCKTPSPGGPIPIPYINIAMDSNLTKGAKSVKIKGDPLAKVNSKIATSMGDEPGTAGGIISSKFKGAMTWIMGSLDVKAEGKSVVRFLDTAMHNGNTSNSAFIDMGGPGFAYGDDEQCGKCGEPFADHRVLASGSIAAEAARIVDELFDLYRQQKPSIDKINALWTREERIKDQLETGVDEAKKAALGRELKQCGSDRTREFNKLSGSTPVLKKIKGPPNFSSGYMIGLGMCCCSEEPKKVAVVSGQSHRVPDGFVVCATDWTVVEAGSKGGWACAAPKIASEMSGHDLGDMIEVCFFPHPLPSGAADLKEFKWWHGNGLANAVPPADKNAPPSERGEWRTERFESGKPVPSCDTCKEKLPELLCKEEDGKCVRKAIGEE